MRLSQLQREFSRWRDEVDQDHWLDTFDLALGFYAGRYPKRRHQLAVDFASQARDIAARIDAEVES